MKFSQMVDWNRGLGLAGALLAGIATWTVPGFAAASPDPMQGGAEAPVSPWKPLASPVTVELRGLAVVSPRVAWASGAKGTVIRTIDGQTFQAIPVPGASTLDLRDIEAWDERNAIALSIGTGEASNVFKTPDGGATWRKVFTNIEATGFWDAIAFWDRKSGALFGDPVRGRFQVFTTNDGGETWNAVPEASLPPALENEGAFAASGSCLVTGPGKRLAFVTGGAVEARVFVSTDGGKAFRVSKSPVLAGAPSKGLFSALWLDKKTVLSVGGDYRERTLAGVNVGRSADSGQTWAATQANPVGFLSSVVRGPGGGVTVVATGLAGTGISADGGKTWATLDATPYNTAGFAGGGGFAVGPKGAIARWTR